MSILAVQYLASYILIADSRHKIFDLKAKNVFGWIVEQTSNTPNLLNQLLTDDARARDAQWTTSATYASGGSDYGNLIFTSFQPKGPFSYIRVFTVEKTTEM